MACAIASLYDGRRKADARVQSIDEQGWRGELRLEYERCNGRTVLARRQHAGPLQVQKSFYPEGAPVCHNIVLHPPGGIVGGDRLRIEMHVHAHAAALLTTPGASKWYRSAGSSAQQNVCMRIDAEASLEWLPQPGILFDGAIAASACEVHVDPAGTYIGWEILCLGRTAAGERFRHGCMLSSTHIVRGGEALWLERARIESGSRLLDSPLGLDGQPVSGTMVAVAGGDRLTHALGAGLLAACRALAPRIGRGGITRLPGLLIARYLGPHAEAAQDYFLRLWQVLRPALLGRGAAAPRIWST
jgi:urease accessory protein